VVNLARCAQAEMLVQQTNKSMGGYCDSVTVSAVANPRNKDEGDAEFDNLCT